MSAKPRRRRLVLFAGGSAASIALGACNLIFGIDERAAAPAGAADGSAAEGGSVEDGGGVDAVSSPGDGAVDTTDADADAAPASCTGISSPSNGVDASACFDTIPHIAGPVVVDGVASELCALPSTTYDVMNGAVKTPPTAAGLPEKVRFFVATTADQIVFHFHVDDPTLVIGNAGPETGDAVYAYVAAGADAGPDDKFEVIVSPPTSGLPTGWHKKVIGSVESDYPAKKAVGRRVEDGYEAEIAIDLSDFGAQVSNTPIHYEVAVSVADDPTQPNTVQLKSYYFADAAGPASGACTGHVADCDPHTWCSSKVTF